MNKLTTPIVETEIICVTDESNSNLIYMYAHVNNR